MRRRPAALAAATLTAVAAVAALTLTSTATAGTTPEPAPAGTSPEVLAALQRDLKLTPAQARTRLDRDRKAAEVQRLLRQALPGTYGGTWWESGWEHCG